MLIVEVSENVMALLQIGDMRGWVRMGMDGSSIGKEGCGKGVVGRGVVGRLL